MSFGWLAPVALCSSMLAATSVVAGCRLRRAAAPEPPRAARVWTQPRAVIIRNATLLPASGPAIPDGAIAFADGKIVSVGRNLVVQAPAGAEEIDAHGGFVTPGIIDAHSHLGVYASPSSVSNDDGNEATAPVTADVNAADSFWPQDPGLRRAAAGGVTSLLILPGSANVIGGRGFPAKLHFGRTAAEVRFPGAKDALKMACGENPRRVYGKGKKVTPSTRMGVAAVLRQAFASAKDYDAKWSEWRKRGGGELGGAPAPTHDRKMETLVGVLHGDILVQNHCYRADEMQTFMSTADDLGFKIRAFHHAVEAYKIRDVLAAKGVGVATWADWWGAKLEMWDAVPENAGLVSEARGRAIIHSDSAYGIQHLNQEAAKALWHARNAGIAVTDEEALRWITLNPAWAMGVDDRTGSLELGKMADVVLWDRDPLSVYAHPQRVWVDGVVTYDARTGPSDPSDFEAGEGARTWARLTPHPAPVPLFRRIPATAQRLPVENADCTVIAGAAVLAETGPIDHGTVVLRGGKIASVRPGVETVAGCRVIDGRAKVLAPGFIDAYSQLGLIEVVLEDAANDAGPRARGEGRERGDRSDAIHAALRAADNVNPVSALFPVARGGGLTAALAVPTGGVVSGQSALVSTDGGVVRAPVAMHLRLGLGAREVIGSTEGAVLELLRALFDDAREYGKRRGDFDDNKFRKVFASRLDLEALQPVLAGKVPLAITANRAVDLRAAVSLARDYGTKLILVGAAEGWMVANELAMVGVPVVVRPSTDLPDTFDAIASRPDNATLLAAAGVRVLFSTFGRPHEVRTLAQEAGNAVVWGLPYADAIRAISANVADSMGFDGGRIAADRRADVVLWSGDPLELSSRPIAMWIGGRATDLTSRQDALFEKYRNLPK